MSGYICKQSHFSEYFNRFEVNIFRNCGVYRFRSECCNFVSICLLAVLSRLGFLKSRLNDTEKR